MIHFRHSILYIPFKSVGYKSGAELWLSEYEAPELEKQLEAIHFQMRPLFEELHAHVRHALSVKYGDDLVPLDGPIPMHLLGNMWGQSWLHVSDCINFKLLLWSSIEYFEDG